MNSGFCQQMIFSDQLKISYAWNLEAFNRVWSWWMHEEVSEFLITVENYRQFVCISNPRPSIHFAFIKNCHIACLIKPERSMQIG